MKRIPAEIFLGGNTLEAMADAVENAVVVVICFSERYQESPNCRLGQLQKQHKHKCYISEAEYAWAQNKTIIPVRTEPKYRPTGWLGMMIGTKMWTNCTESGQVNECAQKIAKELGDKGRKGGMPIPVPEKQSQYKKYLCKCL